MKKNITIFLVAICTTTFAQFKYKKVFNIQKDFGATPSNTLDNTQAFINASEAINKLGGNCTLVIPAGLYIVGRQVPGNVNGWLHGLPILHLNNVKNVQIIGDVNGGTQIKFKAGMRYGSFHPKTKQPFYPKGLFTDLSFANEMGEMVQIESCDNVEISHLNLHGNGKSCQLGGYFGDTGYQLGADGVFILNSSNTTLNYLTARYFNRDGIMVSNYTDSVTNTNTKLINCICDSNTRNGLSWVNGIGLTAINCSFSAQGRYYLTSAPAAGVDIESETQIIRKGKFVNCKFIDNAACGFLADSGDSGDCSFDNCTFIGTTAWSNWTVKPNFIYRNCKFSGSIVYGYPGTDTTKATKYYNCVFDDSPYNGKPAFGRFLMEINGVFREEWYNCTFNAKNNMLFWLGPPNNYQSVPGHGFIMDGCTINFRNTTNPQFGLSCIGLKVKNTTTNVFSPTPMWGQNQLTNCKDLGGNIINYLSTSNKNLIPSKDTWNYK